MSTKDQLEKMDTERYDMDSPRPVSRRALLKGTVVTMPAILTLQSGAALARSSNLISAALPGTTDHLDRTLCLDARYVDPVRFDSHEKYDLGEPADGQVCAINDRDHFLAATAGHGQVDEWEMCERGGTYYYKNRGWQQVDVPQGILVSATALSSFAGYIDIIDC